MLLGSFYRSPSSATSAVALEKRTLVCAIQLPHFLSWSGASSRSSSERDERPGRLSLGPGAWAAERHHERGAGCAPHSEMGGVNEIERHGECLTTEVVLHSASR